MVAFKKAVRYKEPVKAAFLGPASSGKTFTALKVATRIAEHLGKRIAFIDTEHGSSKKYADQFDYDIIELTNYNQKNYIEALTLANDSDEYGVVIVDSLSHAWSGKGGVLEMVDRAAARGANRFAAWREPSPIQNELVETMLALKKHLIVTMRTKMDYVQEKDEETGKLTVKKIGMQPIQRDGLEYEFDIVGDLDRNHMFMVTKTRFEHIDNA